MAERSNKISKAKMVRIKGAEALAEELKRSKVIAVLDVRGMPGMNLSKMKRDLKGRASFKICKKSIMKFAIEKIKDSKKNVHEITKFFEGAQPALLLSDENPFKLYKIISGSKSPARAKAGKPTPKDITVQGGDTGLPPGPVIGDLQKAGLPAKIQGGKIVIDKDTVVAKKGEEVRKEVAEALIKLGIEPLEVGISLLAAWEDGMILPKEALEIDEALIFRNFANAHSQARSLAMFSGYACKETIAGLLQKAHMEADSLSTETGYLTKDNIQKILARANAQASALDSRIPKA